MQVVYCAFPGRIKKQAHVFTSTHAECDGRVCRAKRCCANGGNILAEALGEYCHAVDVTQLALVGAEPKGCVTFYMFDILVALANGLTYVRNAGVILVVDELL